MDLKRERDANFFTDLTLGLVDTLNGIPGVRDVNVSVRGGADKSTIAAWEQRQNVSLPTHLRHLYLATDGFALTWNYMVAGKVLPLGNLEIHPLARVTRVGSGRGSGDALAPTITDLALAEDPYGGCEPAGGPSLYTSRPCTPKCRGKLSARSTFVPTFHASKLFEIDSCQGNGRVVVAYPGRGEGSSTMPNGGEGSFWYLDLAHRIHLLAPNVLTYWRLMLAHLGMPQWQSLVAGVGLTPWAQQWYQIIAPHLLDTPRVPRHTQPELVNKLDWSVFRSRKAGKGKAAKESTKDTAKTQKNSSTVANGGNKG